LEPFVIGVTGGSASGKTMFLNALLSRFQEEDICLISQDNYYHPIDQQPLDENGVRNFDTPGSIDAKSFAADLEKIKAGESFQRQQYTFNTPGVVSKMLDFHPAPIIVVEGLFVMYFHEINHLLDLRLFIDAKTHIKLKRRIQRDKEERDSDLDDVLYRFEKHVMPTFDRYLYPLKEDADLIIPNNTNFDVALEVLAGFMHARLSKVKGGQEKS